MKDYQEHNAVDDVAILQKVFIHMVNITKDTFKIANSDAIYKMVELTNSPVRLEYCLF